MFNVLGVFDIRQHGEQTNCRIVSGSIPAFQVDTEHLRRQCTQNGNSFESDWIDVPAKTQIETLLWLCQYRNPSPTAGVPLVKNTASGRTVDLRETEGGGGGNRYDSQHSSERNKVGCSFSRYSKTGNVRINVTLRHVRATIDAVEQQYRGADKPLARPGRKEARKHVRDARGFNKIETRAVKFFFFPARQGAEGNSRHSDRNISLFPSWSS